MRVLHFTTAVAASDGVTQGVLLAVELFRQLGLEAHPLAEHIPGELRDQFIDYRGVECRPDDLLCFHHSIGVGPEVEHWLHDFPGRRWMLYHNITPPLFFPAGSAHDLACSLGREQIRRWRGWFEASLADSSYNLRDLRFAGYPEAQVLPLLLALDPGQTPAVDQAMLARLQGSFNLLFVGRLVGNKCQHQLVELMGRLRDRVPVPLALHLAGGTSTPAYEQTLRARINELGLGSAVHLHGKVNDATRNALYAAADLYLSLSEHEGFGIPLLEAMQWACPVAAYDSGAVAETLGGAGLLLRSKAPSELDRTVLGLIGSTRQRLRLRLGQRERLVEFTRAALLRRLADCVERHFPGATVQGAAPAVGGLPAQPAVLRIEGPFDSHYSIAQVNREMARAAAMSGWALSLGNTEGGGDYPADQGFLDANAPDLLPALRPSADGRPATLGIRNLYPPRTDHAGAELTLLGPFGWEESRLALRHVDHINHHADGVLAMSSYVRKVLQDSGVTVPVLVSGLGVTPLPESGYQPALFGLPKDGYLLHVSSAFPRKGLDVLFEAFDRFTADGASCGLVIKTSDNPHNQVAHLLQAHRWTRVTGLPQGGLYRRAQGDSWIAVLDADLAPVELAALYAGALALVMPTRGEGFGLPMAEAMQLGIPVVTTEAGGQADFCTPDTALMVSCRYGVARTHLNEAGDSLWMEPDLDSLLAALERVRSRVVDAGLGVRARQLLQSRFTWDAVWGRTQAFAEWLRGQAGKPEPPFRVALVCTWNSLCGIAAYAGHVTSAFEPGQLDVFANVDAQPLTPLEPGVTRNWRTLDDSGPTDDLEPLAQELLASAHSLVLIQFSFGFFDIPTLGRLIEKLKSNGRRVVVEFHNTRDIEPPHEPKTLRAIVPALARCDRLLVHTLDDLNRLCDWGLRARATMIPLGVPVPPALPHDTVPLLATTGFLLPQKGLFELVDAFERLKPHWPGLKLLLLTARHAAAVSGHEAARLAARVAASPFAADITLDTRFLPEEQILVRLAQASLIVYPYRENQESISSAARLGLATGRPVAVTPAAQFDEVREITYPLAGFEADDIARSLLALREDAARHPLAGAQAAWVHGRRWDLQSRRVAQMLKAVASEQPPDL